MTSTGTGRNRLSRLAAKEVPHRSEDRFFAAKADVKKACEELLHTLRTSSASAPMIADLSTAVSRMEQQVKEIEPDEAKSATIVRELGKQVQHLQVAEDWVAHAERVLDRLGDHAKETRERLLEAQDSVMWCVRAQHWDGELTAAAKRLEQLVKEAEAQAARLG